MPVSKPAQKLSRALVVEPDPPVFDDSGLFGRLGIEAEQVIYDPDLVQRKTRKQIYDVILWRIASEEDLSVFKGILCGGGASFPPTLVIAAGEARNSPVHSLLLDLVGRKIRDFCFEDEPEILSRMLRRVIAEQAADSADPAIWELADTDPALATLVEATPLGVIALTPEGTVGLWNQSAVNIYGWRREEVLGKPLPTIPEDGQQEFRELLESQMHGVSHQGTIVRQRRKDGALIDVSLCTALLRDKRGRIQGTLVLSTDVTERRRAEQEHLQLLESERDAREQIEAMGRFQELLEAAPDSIIEVDEHGNIVLLNAVTERLFGYSRGELLGSPVDRLVPDDFRTRHGDHRKRYSERPTTRPMASGLNLYGQRKDGTLFPVEISLSPVRSARGVRVSAIIRDVSERKGAEERIKEINDKFTAQLSIANQQLEERNREIERTNRLKSEFLASMSHELRTPLHTIIGFAQLLSEELEGALNAKQQRFVNHIQKDSLHLLDLINGILDISKIEAGKLELNPENFDPTAALIEVTESIAGLAAAKSIALHKQTCEPVTIRADRMRFKQILYNLLSNAVKFTPEGGRISVDCSNFDSYVQVCVSDTGIGIPKAEQAAIFDKFYQVGSTTKGVPEGTGLGLAITKHLVEQHGGRLWLESEPGAGTRFYFTLPL